MPDLPSAADAVYLRMWTRFEDFARDKTDHDIAELDDICAALAGYFDKHPPRDGGMALPNRVPALAALDAAYEWERACWEHD